MCLQISAKFIFVVQKCSSIIWVINCQIPQMSIFRSELYFYSLVYNTWSRSALWILHISFLTAGNTRDFAYILNPFHSFSPVFFSLAYILSLRINYILQVPFQSLNLIEVRTLYFKQNQHIYFSEKLRRIV